MVHSLDSYLPRSFLRDLYPVKLIRQFDWEIQELQKLTNCSSNCQPGHRKVIKRLANFELLQRSQNALTNYDLGGKQVLNVTLGGKTVLNSTFYERSNLVVPKVDLGGYSILFYSILFQCSLFYSILFYSILFYFYIFIILFSILFFPIVFYFLHIALAPTYVFAGVCKQYKAQV